MEILAYLFLFVTYSYSVCKHIVNTFAFIPIVWTVGPFPFGPTRMSCNLDFNGNVYKLITWWMGKGIGCEQVCQDLHGITSHQNITAQHRQKYVRAVHLKTTIFRHFYLIRFDSLDIPTKCVFPWSGDLYWQIHSEKTCPFQVKD